MFRNTQKLIERMQSLPLAKTQSQLYSSFPILAALLQNSAMHAINEHQDTGEYPLLQHALNALKALEEMEINGFSYFQTAMFTTEVHEQLQALDEDWLTAIRQYGRIERRECNTT